MPRVSEVYIGIISDESIKKLVNRYGGSTLYVPIEIAKEHSLSQLIGFEEARRLSRAHRGEHLFIPKVHKVTKGFRDIELALRYVQGNSTKEIAKEFEITTRSVTMIVSRVLGKKLNDLKKYEE